MRPRTPLLVACLALPMAAGYAHVPSLRPHLRAPPVAVQLCADDEVARAQKRRDEEAIRSEWDLPSGSGGGKAEEAQDGMLRERIDLLETKERDLGEIKRMLGIMEQQFGVPFIGENDEILFTAWVFVALNMAIPVYLFNQLVLAPLSRSGAL
jgi:hypothetical protein